MSKITRIVHTLPQDASVADMLVVQQAAWRNKQSVNFSVE